LVGRSVVVVGIVNIVSVVIVMKTSFGGTRDYKLIDLEYKLIDLAIKNTLRFE